MQKIEVVVRITKDHCPPQEQTIFEWFDLMRNPTDALSRPDLEINLEHHRVFKHGTEVYMSRYEYGVLSLMAQHPGKLFTKEQIFEAVWHKDSESYLRAVTSTIGRIRQKIEDDKDHPRYIKTVSNIGYSCCLFQCWRYASLKHGSVQQVVLVLNLPACAPCEPFLQVLSSQNSASSFTSIVLYRSGE